MSWSTAYDGFGRVTSSTLAMGGISRTLGQLYDPNGNRTRISHFDSFFAYEYDGLNRFSRLLENGGTTVAIALYDPAGRLNRSGWAAATDYRYDPAGRLETLAHDLAGDGGDQTIGLTYNPAGQIRSRSGTNPAFTWSGASVDRPYSVNGQNQYVAVGPATFAYDANGNLTSDGSTSFVYDVENRLVSASGRRMRRSGRGRAPGGDAFIASCCGLRRSLVIVRRRPNLGPGGKFEHAQIQSRLCGGPFARDRGGAGPRPKRA